MSPLVSVGVGERVKEKGSGREGAIQGVQSGASVPVGGASGKKGVVRQSGQPGCNLADAVAGKDAGQGVSVGEE